MANPILATEGIRLFLRSLRVRFSGFRKYQGNAGEICRKIVKDCWNGRYFQASAGHFSEFYTRDFGWCVDSLLELGYRNEVLKTLEYALGIFSRNGQITTAISPSGRVFDFPTYSPDSLAFLMHSLAAAKAKSLVSKYKDFLNREIMRFYKKAIDPDTGLVKPSHFSSMKDHAIRKSSCYDNAMAAMLCSALKKHRELHNPLKDYNFRKIIKQNFWTGSYFLDDLSGEKAVTGDANLFPFWTGVFDDIGMMREAFSRVQEEGLDKPCPLKYSKKGIRQRFILVSRIFARNYEKDTVWMHMGPLYAKMMKRVDSKKAKSYAGKYKSLIEKYRTFPEVLDKKGKPYSTPFYYCDEAMLWAANYLTLNP